MFKTILLVVIVLFSSQLAAEKVYKWVDENGQIHYSSQKPVNHKAETMKLKKAPKVVPKPTTDDENKAAAGIETADAAETEAEAAAKEAARAQLAAADIINNKKQCDLARKNYQALNATVRVSRTNDKGEVVRMTDDERVNSLLIAQQAISQYCQ
jgi:hypothetical protein